MDRLDFASYMAILRRYLDENEYPNQLSSLYVLFDDCLEELGMENYDFDEGLVSKWLSGKAKLSTKISGYYLKPENRADLSYRLSNLISDMYDPEMACNDLHDLILRDISISESKKSELLSSFPCSSIEDMEDLFTEVLLFVMKRKFTKTGSNSKSLILAGSTSLVMDDLIIGCKIPKPCRCFVGRESELDKLHQMLTANGMVFLHGIAGIGKSEMAKTYAWLRRKEYVNILYVMHSGDLESDIADLDFIDDRPEDDRQERFRKHNRLLRSLREDSLLIIDNYDTGTCTDHMLPIIRKYRCKVLITTRNNYRDSSCMELSEMPADDLMHLADLVYPDAENHRETIESVIRTVHSHTMAAELAFRLMETGFLEPEDILTKLREERVALDDEDNIALHKDGEYRKATYYQHISKLFSLFLLTEDHKYIMRNMIFAPAIGISGRLLAKWCGIYNMNSINELIDAGLIQKKERWYISLHPIIQEVGITDLVPDTNNCRALLDSIQFICLRHGENIECHRTVFAVIRNAMLLLKCDDPAYYLRFLENVYPMMAEYGDDIGANLVLSELSGLLRNSEIGNNADRAMLLDYKANTEKNPSKAVKLGKEALELMKGLEQFNYHIIANIHNNLGNRYKEQKQFDKAREHMETGMRLLEQYQDMYTHDTVVISLNYASLLADLQEYNEALRATERIEALIRSYQTEPGFDYAKLLEVRCKAYILSGDRQKAVECYMQMVQILEGVYDGDSYEMKIGASELIA